jgi:hypothetical protein
MNYLYKILFFSAILTACGPSPTSSSDSISPLPEKADTTKDAAIPIKAVLKDTLAKSENPDSISPSEAPKPSPPKRAVLSFEKTTMAFDTLSEGEETDVVFSFTNKGNANLSILDASASCGCTYPSFPFLPIPPGETGEIKVTFNSKGKMGRQRPKIRIFSNAGRQDLYLEGFVRYPGQ